MTFRDYLLTLGLSRRTTKMYLDTVAAGERFCAAHGCTLKTAPPAVLAAWVETKPRTWSSRKLLHCACAHYWNFTRRRQPPLGVLRVPPKPEAVCRALDDEEAARLAAVARAAGYPKGLAVLMGLYLAFRRAEIARLRLDDFAGDGWVRVIGKFDKQGWLPVHPELVRALGDARSAIPGPWIFPGRFGGPVNPATVWAWTREVSRAADLPPVATHRLRHTALATANDTLGDLRAVQAFARHSRPETTAGYTRVRRAKLVAVSAALRYGRSTPQVSSIVADPELEAETGG